MADVRASSIEPLMERSRVCTARAIPSSAANMHHIQGDVSPSRLQNILHRNYGLKSRYSLRSMNGRIDDEDESLTDDEEFEEASPKPANWRTRLLRRFNIAIKLASPKRVAMIMGGCLFQLSILLIAFYYLNSSSKKGDMVHSSTQRMESSDVYVEQSASKCEEALESIQERFKSSEERFRILQSKFENELQSLKEEIKRWHEATMVDKETMAKKIHDIAFRQATQIEEKLRKVFEKELESTSVSSPLKPINLSIPLPSCASPAVDDVKSIINNALALYDADKTGLPDYALESSGGQIVSKRCSPTFHPHAVKYNLFGIPLWSTSSTPRTAIQSHPIRPGNCWAFHGSLGSLVVRLSMVIIPTAVSYEHVPRSLSLDGRIAAAPKEILIRGLRDPDDNYGVVLGEFIYQDNGASLQYFELNNKDQYPTPFEYIEFAVLSNHGSPDYTCLYRVRVHGKPLLTESP